MLPLSGDKTHLHAAQEPPHPTQALTEGMKAPSTECGCFYTKRGSRCPWGVCPDCTEELVLHTQLLLWCPGVDLGFPFSGNTR